MVAGTGKSPQARFALSACLTGVICALLLLPTGAWADQIEPTIDTNYYNPDPEPEDIYTLITGADAGGDPLAGDGPLYICGTSACTGDASIEGRTATLDNLDGYAQVIIYEDGPAGSGFDQDGDVFLRQQHNEMSQVGNNTYETAYNTDSTDLQSLSDPSGPLSHNYENMAKDTGAGGEPDFNHAILFSDELIDSNGNLNFLLDINESESTSDILLDELSFFVSSSNMLNLYDPDCDYAGDGSNTGCLVNTDGSIDTTAIKVWDMDWDDLMAALMLDNSNTSGMAGSGDYDAIFALDATLFINAIAALGGGDGDYYIYLENTMGRAEAIDENGNLLEGVTCTYKPNGTIHKCSGGEVDAGFEEWKIATFEEPGVPLPGTALLLGGLALLRKVHR